MDSLSYLSNADSAYIDSLYQSYKEDPQSVDFGWQKFFEGFDFGQQSEAKTTEQTTDGAPPAHVLKEINVLNMIHGYRSRGIRKNIYYYKVGVKLKIHEFNSVQDNNFNFLFKSMIYLN